MAVLGAVVADRTERPGDDLTSALITARDEGGDRLTHEELIGTLVLMIIAGHETTLNLITNAVRALCGHRDQLGRVTNGEASWSDVVEETLRWDAPVSYFPFRYPVRDLTVDGTVIPRGTPVLSGYSAAGETRPRTGPTPTASTSPGPPGPAPPGICPSATAPTTASAPRWPVWSPPWPWSGCSPASPASTWTCPRWTSPVTPASWATASGRFPYGWHRGCRRGCEVRSPEQSWGCVDPAPVRSSVGCRDT
ncbi:hypothetical protein QF035_009639 [Streptomyces umbrinus]|uniref:Cytochrome P450 n=1 Tax=Streptomyces umbrinus TaxID=67370 RepID=A0ABU0T8C0_9ACTN|nr:hypothetical protein [Streptomyces umbrinus]